MKGYESEATALRFDRTLPVYARIDGRSFSRFTRNMEKPFDEQLSKLMNEVTVYLIEQTGAIVGYTQSDEISLLFEADQSRSQTSIMFGGREFKLTSHLAALATARFVKDAITLWPAACERQLPSFDARVFELPNREEAANAMLWRFFDGERNAISMLGQKTFGHSALFGVSTGRIIEALYRLGIRLEDQPSAFRYGTFWRRMSYLSELSESDLASIPEMFRPSGVVSRTRMERHSIEFRGVSNRVGFLFNKEVPDLAQKDLFEQSPGTPA